MCKKNAVITYRYRNLLKKDTRSPEASLSLPASLEDTLVGQDKIRQRRWWRDTVWIRGKTKKLRLLSTSLFTILSWGIQNTGGLHAYWRKNTDVSEILKSYDRSWEGWEVIWEGLLTHLLIGVWGEWKSSLGTWFRRVVSSCLDTVQVVDYSLLISLRKYFLTRVEHQHRGGKFWLVCDCLYLYCHGRRRTYWK